MNTFLLCFAINFFGGFLFGYDTGIIAPGLDPLSKEFHIDQSDLKKGIVTSAILLGAMIGCLGAGIIADKIGRRKAVWILSILTTLGTVASAFSPNYIVLTVLRIIQGVGVGLTAVTCPLYVSEMAPLERSGLLGTFFQIAITLGIFGAYIAGYALESVKYNWRIMFGIGAVPSLLLLLVSVVSMPESNEWLRKKENMQGLLQNDGEISEPKGSLFARKNLRLLFLGFMLSFTSQFTGINTIIYYAPQTFKSAGFVSSEGSLLATMGVGGWNCITTIIAAVIVDRFGRRLLFLISLGFMVVSTLLLALDYQFFENTKTLGILAMIGLFVFIAAFEAGPGCLFWVIVNELYPSDIRAVASSIINMLQWLFNLIISLSFLVMVKSIGLPATYFFFTGVGLFGLIIFIFMLPETKAQKDDSNHSLS